MNFKIEAIRKTHRGPRTWLLYWNGNLYGHGLKDALLQELRDKLKAILYEHLHH